MLINAHHTSFCFCDPNSSESSIDRSRSLNNLRKKFSVPGLLSNNPPLFSLAELLLPSSGWTRKILLNKEKSEGSSSSTLVVPSSILSFVSFLSSNLSLKNFRKNPSFSSSSAGFAHFSSEFAISPSSFPSFLSSNFSLKSFRKKPSFPLWLSFHNSLGLFPQCPLHCLLMLHWQTLPKLVTLLIEKTLTL